MLNIVIPMAGRGSRFLNAGYTRPKPLIEIYGFPMITYVTKNVSPSCEHKFIFICQREHLLQYDFEQMLREIEKDCIIVPIDYVTEGAACTVLLAEKYINNEEQLMIVNSDQYVDIDINNYLKLMETNENDGLIMTMPSNHPKWSYIKYDEKNIVTMVKEKEVISDQATVGIYNFKKGSDFVYYAKKMIEKEKRVNNEFYVAPVYNEMIEAGKKITFYDIGEKMYGLGVPEDLELFINSGVAKHIFD